LEQPDDEFYHAVAGVQQFAARAVIDKSVRRIAGINGG